MVAYIMKPLSELAGMHAYQIPSPLPWLTALIPDRPPVYPGIYKLCVQTSSHLKMLQLAPGSAIRDCLYSAQATLSSTSSNVMCTSLDACSCTSGLSHIFFIQQL